MGYSALTMNLGLILITLAATNVIISVPLVVYAVSQSQYDEDGFTIFPTKSDWYMTGYRAGVIQADSDIKTKFDTEGIDARPEHITCPRPDLNPDYCLGFKDGYSDEAMDQLE